MSDIKLILSAFCNVLRVVVNVDIKADHLRLAKFNKHDMDCITVMWNVLHKLCCESFNEDMNGGCKGDGDIVMCVKQSFMSSHFDGFAFTCLPHDMSFGSRELLLAFGWLVAETKILETRILYHMKTKLFNDVFTSASSTDNLSKTEYDTTGNVLTEEDICHQIMWLAGRIKYNLRAISNMTSEKLNLFSKVQTATTDVYNIPYLTVEQMSLLRNKGKLLGKEDVISQVSALLKDYFYFVEHENHFWNWMESVVVEDTNNESTFKGNENDFSRFMTKLKDDVRIEIMKDTSRDVDDTLDNLKSKLSNCTYNNEIGFDISLVEVNKNLALLNTLCKNNVKDVIEYVQRVSSDCTS